MFNSTFRSWIIGGCLAATAIITIVSVMAGATVSTTALFLAVGVSSAVLFVLIDRSAPKPTIAEILYQVEKDGRS